MSIFVGNLPFRAEQEDVMELFSPFGEVSNCSLPLERDTGRKRGFAFVEMADEAVEASAIESLQGAELMGRPLRINKAEPRGSAPRRGGGGYGGGYGGGGYGGGKHLRLHQMFEILVYANLTNILMFFDEKFGTFSENGGGNLHMFCK